MGANDKIINKGLDEARTSAMGVRLNPGTYQPQKSAMGVNTIPKLTLPSVTLPETPKTSGAGMPMANTMAGNPENKQIVGVNPSPIGVTIPEHSYVNPPPLEGTYLTQPFAGGVKPKRQEEPMGPIPKPPIFTPVEEIERSVGGGGRGIGGRRYFSEEGQSQRDAEIGALIKNLTDKMDTPRYIEMTAPNGSKYMVEKGNKLQGNLVPLLQAAVMGKYGMGAHRLAADASAYNTALDAETAREGHQVTREGHLVAKQIHGIDDKSIAQDQQRAKDIFERYKIEEDDGSGTKNINQTATLLNIAENMAMKENGWQGLPKDLQQPVVKVMNDFNNYVNSMKSHPDNKNYSDKQLRDYYWPIYKKSKSQSVIAQ